MRPLIVIAALAIAGSSLANPTWFDDNIYLDLGEGDNCNCPAPGEFFVVTVLLGELNQASDGILGIAFMFDRTFSGFKLSQTNLLGGLDFGDVEVDGWVLTSGADCATPDPSGFIRIAEMEYLFQGAPGTITPLGHPVDGNTFANCDNALQSWHLPEDNGVPGGIAGLCMEPPEGCGTVPVENASWGSIKAMFR